MNLEKPAREIQPGLVEGVPAVTRDEMCPDRDGMGTPASRRRRRRSRRRVRRSVPPRHRHRHLDAGATAVGVDLDAAAELADALPHAGDADAQ